MKEEQERKEQETPEGGCAPLEYLFFGALGSYTLRFALREFQQRLAVSEGTFYGGLGVILLLGTLWVLRGPKRQKNLSQWWLDFALLAFFLVYCLGTGLALRAAFSLSGTVAFWLAVGSCLPLLVWLVLAREKRTRHKLGEARPE